SGIRPPDFSKETSTRRSGRAEEPASLPAGLEHVALRSVRSVNVLESPSKKTVQEPLDEVKEMDSTVRIGLSDIVTDSANYQRLVQWAGMHFSGLDYILNSIKDAGGELVIDAMKQARDRVIWRNLAAPRSVLDDLVADETRAGAASVPLHPLQLTERSPRI